MRFSSFHHCCFSNFILCAYILPFFLMPGAHFNTGVNVMEHMVGVSSSPLRKSPPTLSCVIGMDLAGGQQEA
jgi:hypothetical protein